MISHELAVKGHDRPMPVSGRPSHPFSMSIRPSHARRFYSSPASNP